MRIALWLAVIFLPLGWGWATHWLLERLWPPASGGETSSREIAGGRTDFVDYQI